MECPVYTFEGFRLKYIPRPEAIDLMVQAMHYDADMQDLSSRIYGDVVLYNIAAHLVVKHCYVKLMPYLIKH